MLPKATALALACATEHLLIDGRSYLPLAARLVTGWMPSRSWVPVPSCAGFVANALEAGGLAMSLPTRYVTPADLAALFGAVDPRPSGRCSTSVEAGRR